MNPLIWMIGVGLLIAIPLIPGLFDYCKDLPFWKEVSYSLSERPMPTWLPTLEEQIIALDTTNSNPISISQDAVVNVSPGATRLVTAIQLRPFLNHSNRRLANCARNLLDIQGAKHAFTIRAIVDIVSPDHGPMCSFALLTNFAGESNPTN